MHLVTAQWWCAGGGQGSSKAAGCQDQSCCCCEASLRRAMRASAAAAICSRFSPASLSVLDCLGGFTALPCLLLHTNAMLYFTTSCCGAQYVCRLACRSCYNILSSALPGKVVLCRLQYIVLMHGAVQRGDFPVQLATTDTVTNLLV